MSQGLPHVTWSDMGMRLQSPLEGWAEFTNLSGAVERDWSSQTCPRVTVK